MVRSPPSIPGDPLHGIVFAKLANVDISTRPDHCDGSYDVYCHMTPEFDNIPSVLQRHGQDELLAFMDRYWIAATGPNSHLWAHEFNKHGTCFNTLAPACYGNEYQLGFEVVDYFTQAARLFRMLDTYVALERAGIVPHPKKHYPLVDVQAALERYSGGKVVLRCNGRGGRRDILHEAWYVYFVKGSLQTGGFVPAKELGKERNAGNCAHWVRYLPKRAKGGEL
jgi:ribonuclease T2